MMVSLGAMTDMMMMGLVSLKGLDQRCLIVEINGHDRGVALLGLVRALRAGNDRDMMLCCLNKFLSGMLSYSAAILFIQCGHKVRELAICMMKGEHPGPGNAHRRSRPSPCD